MDKNQKSAPDDRFSEVRATYPTREEFRASIEGENVKTLRNSAKEFEIDLTGKNSKEEILDTIADTIYPATPNAGAPEGAGEGAGGDDGDNTNAPEGDKPTPSHDPATDQENAKAAEKAPPAAAKTKKNMDSTTESASEVKGASEGDVIATQSPANPNERWTEPNEEKKKRLSARALSK